MAFARLIPARESPAPELNTVRRAPASTSATPPSAWPGSAASTATACRIPVAACTAQPDSSAIQTQSPARRTAACPLSARPVKPASRPRPAPRPSPKRSARRTPARQSTAEHVLHLHRHHRRPGELHAQARSERDAPLLVGRYKRRPAGRRRIGLQLRRGRPGGRQRLAGARPRGSPASPRGDAVEAELSQAEYSSAERIEDHRPRWPRPLPAAVSSAVVTAAALPANRDLPSAGAPLRGLLPVELAAWATAASAPAYRAEQIFRWLHGQTVEAIDEMVNVPRALRHALVGAHPLQPLTADVVQTARDGTRKLRWQTHDGRAIESVLIPDDDADRNRLTQCVSSQVGCALDCGFCATAKLGFGASSPPARSSTRSIAAGLPRLADDPTRRAGADRVTNLVFMGMGEPLHNYDNVLRALAHPQRRAGRRLLAPPHHRVDGGPGAGHREAGAGGPGSSRQPGGLAQRDDRRGARPDHADQQEVEHRARCSRRCASSRSRSGGASPSSTCSSAASTTATRTRERLPELLRGIPSKVNLIPWNRRLDGPAP